jgi:hypothetical protein
LSWVEVEGLVLPELHSAPGGLIIPTLAFSKFTGCVRGGLAGEPTPAGEPIHAGEPIPPGESIPAGEDIPAGECDAFNAAALL